MDPLILLEWDIANAMVFDSMRRKSQTKYRIEDEVHQTHRQVKFNEDNKALVLLSLHDKDNS